MQTGMVQTQATTIFFTTPHLTAETFTMLPTPIIAVEMMWVVLTGNPKWEAVRIMLADAISTENPWIGFIFITFELIVLMILHPPVIVPKARVAAQAHITQRGISKTWPLMTPAVINDKVMIPIVFCASFEPWLKAKNPDENN